MLFIFVLECPSQLRLGYLHLNILKSESTNSTKEDEEKECLLLKPWLSGMRIRLWGAIISLKPLNYFVPRSSADSHIHSFYPSTIRLWNSLPNSIKSTNSISSFKSSSSSLVELVDSDLSMFTNLLAGMPLLRELWNWILLEAYTWDVWVEGDLN